MLASRSRVNATNNDFCNLRGVCCFFSLTFKHSDSKICLVVFVSLESGLFFTWNSRVVRDNLLVFLLVLCACEDRGQKALLDFVRDLHANGQRCDIIENDRRTLIMS